MEKRRGGDDGIVAEMIKCLPLAIVYILCHLFALRLTGEVIEHVRSNGRNRC